MSQRKAKPAWRQSHHHYRVVPVDLSPFEVPTWLKTQDIREGVVELRSENSANEVLNIVRRKLQPLELWHRHGLQTHLYEAGKRYGALWRQVCRPKSPPHSDTTRIIVDGSGAAPDDFGPQASGEFEAAQRALGDEEATGFLNRLCGAEDWPAGDKRRFKRVCMRGLKRLVEHWRRR